MGFWLLRFRPPAAIGATAASASTAQTAMHRVSRSRRGATPEIAVCTANEPSDVKLLQNLVQTNFAGLALGNWK